MKIKFLILCFLGVVAFTDCGKVTETFPSGPSSVNGQAIDQTTGKGVPYANVALIGENNNVIGAWGQQLLKDTIADVNGNFSFNFNYASGNSYSVQAQAPNYYNDGNAFADLSAGQNNNVKIKMVPKGWVRFNLVNKPPLDTIYKFVMSGFDGEPILYNIYKDTFFIVQGFGNKATNFDYAIQIGVGFTNYTGCVYLKALDTVTFTINY